jgi:hypothetical protein
MSERSDKFVLQRLELRLEYAHRFHEGGITCLRECFALSHYHGLTVLYKLLEQRIEALAVFS